MKKPLLIYILFFAAFSFNAIAQKTYFKMVQGNAEMQIVSHAGDSLGLGYHVIYIDSNNSPFKGIITTYFTTNKNNTAAACAMVFNTDDLPLKQMNSGDTVLVYTHIKVNSHYFDNGPVNVVVIWPTGAKNGNFIECKDSIVYPKKVNVIDLADIENAAPAVYPICIYPNPVKSYLGIRLNDENIKLKTVRILDISGREVLNINEPVRSLNVSGIRNGTYFLVLDLGENRKKTYSFVISR